VVVIVSLLTRSGSTTRRHGGYSFCGKRGGRGGENPCSNYQYHNGASDKGENS
jgi:hypothetical protein